MLFAELGRGEAPNLFLRLEYDGSIHTNGGALGHAFEQFGVISGTGPSTNAMEQFLRERNTTTLSLEGALEIALDAWTIGHLALTEEAREEPVAPDVVVKHRNEQLAVTRIEAAVLEHASPLPITWRALVDSELRPTLQRRQ